MLILPFSRWTFYWNKKQVPFAWRDHVGIVWKIHWFWSENVKMPLHMCPTQWRHLICQSFHSSQHLFFLFVIKLFYKSSNEWIYILVSSSSSTPPLRLHFINFILYYYCYCLKSLRWNFLMFQLKWRANCVKENVNISDNFHGKRFRLIQY